MTQLFSVKTMPCCLPQPIPYVCPHAFGLNVAFDWIYLICLRILQLLSRLMFAIPAIVYILSHLSVTGYLL